LGVPIGTTATFGCPGLLLDGPPIETATGPGFRLGAGPGSMTSRGATRRSTTVAGQTSGEIGAGCPARSLSEPATHQHLWPSSAGRVSAWRSRLVEAVATWGGFPWAREKSM